MSNQQIKSITQKDLGEQWDLYYRASQIWEQDKYDSEIEDTMCQLGQAYEELQKQFYQQQAQEQPEEPHEWDTYMVASRGL